MHQLTALPDRLEAAERRSRAAGARPPAGARHGRGDATSWGLGGEGRRLVDRLIERFNVRWNIGSSLCKL